MAIYVLVNTLLVATAAAQSSHPQSAQSTAKARRTQSLIRNIASPFCPNTTLEGCPSSKASEWRQDIRQWVAEDLSNAEIRQRLQARVPDFDLTGKKLGQWDHGLPLLVWGVATFLLLLAGWMQLRRRPLRQSAGSAVETAKSESIPSRTADLEAQTQGEARLSGPHDQALYARLDAELQALDE